MQTATHSWNTCVTACNAGCWNAIPPLLRLEQTCSMQVLAWYNFPVAVQRSLHHLPSLPVLFKCNIVYKPWDTKYTCRVLHTPTLGMYIFTNLRRLRFMSDLYYCVKCKKKTEMKDPQRVTTKNGKPALKGPCTVCGTTVFTILGAEKK